MSMDVQQDAIIINTNISLRQQMIRLPAVLPIAFLLVMALCQFSDQQQAPLPPISKELLLRLTQQQGQSLVDSINVCEPNCIACDENNPSQCQQCQVGYVLQTNLSCSACSHGCAACQGVQMCVQCLPGYLLITQGYISRCIKCPQGCQTCQALSFQTMFLTETINCKTCYPGYYRVPLPDYNNIYGCSPCLPGCSSCTTNSSCSACVSGFGYNAISSSCYVCQANCLKCSPSQGCQMCSLGYYANTVNSSTSTCSQCLLNCVQCSSSTQCTRCVPGYYPLVQVNTTTNVTSSFCMSCPPPCSICYNQIVCLSCPKAYFLNIVQASTNSSNQTTPTIQSAVCQPCVAFCQTCTNSTVCLSCQSGYYINSQGFCLLCGSACQSCISQTQCLQCVGSYYLSSGVCKPCSQLCSMCTVTVVNGNQMEVCHNCTSVSYAPLGGICTLCSDISDGCLTCSSPYNCLTCLQDYYLINGQCQQSYGGLGAVYIVLFCIAGAIGLAAILFGVWACWRHRSGYGVASQDSSNPALKASYYQIP